jgi:hypothetical protein
MFGFSASEREAAKVEGMYKDVFNFMTPFKKALVFTADAYDMTYAPSGNLLKDERYVAVVLTSILWLTTKWQHEPAIMRKAIEMIFTFGDPVGGDVALQLALSGTLLKRHERLAEATSQVWMLLSATTGGKNEEQLMMSLAQIYLGV